MNCTIENCQKSVWAKNLCPMHLRRLRLYGDPTYTTRTPNGEKLAWLMSTIHLDTDNCIIWPFRVGNHGYGFLTFEGTQLLAHHVVLKLHNRSCPAGLEETRHLCNNKTCVNNRHLMIGDPIDNATDRVVAGTSPKGSKHGLSKLTEHDVKLIRETPKYWGVNVALANQFGVSKSLISHIRLNKRWHHV